MVIRGTKNEIAYFLSAAEAGCMDSVIHVNFSQSENHSLKEQVFFGGEPIEFISTLCDDCIYSGSPCPYREEKNEVDV